uniref:Lipopolysaccharide transport system ATP-binding protein n=1 Tax=Candidatus Kentrum sp. SD TaxID=2126332 RepID=A0A451BLW3_9GAMM|nr:MAG: lipopolysaccharide transport system ATP-binding protein [Candidatus Kentron sp. SD]
MSSNAASREMKQTPADTEMAIRVSNLSKVYQIYDRPEDRLKQSILPPLQRLIGRQPKNHHRKFWALKDVSFEVGKGETIGIIGRNGAGKSTLLQIICGTLNPSSGTVETNGRVAALLELGSGFNPEFTGRENVYMNASILGLTKDEIDAKFDEISAFADIGDFIEQPVKSYSSGMLVRLAFSVIAHVDADILIIDEALAVGDAFFTQKCMRFLRNFMKIGTALFVSHDTGAVLNLCNQAICLKDGSVSKHGPPREVIKFYLEDIYEAIQGGSAGHDSHGDYHNQPKEIRKRDMRLDFLNQTTLRNDIELFPMSTDAASFGKGGAKISNVRLLDERGNPLAWVVGGELVKLVIDFEAKEDLFSPIIGFQFKDRLGQVIFADNTYITYRENPLSITAGCLSYAAFEFHMPLLPVENYSISSAIATGTQEEHIQHHWIHDTMILKVHNTSVCLGLIGVPMEKIEIIV